MPAVEPVTVIGEGDGTYYSEVNANIRHYSGLRHAVLTAYLVLMGLMGAMSPEGTAPGAVTPWLEFSVGIVAILVLGVVGIILEARTSALLDSFKDYARLIENNPKCGMWSRIEKARPSTHDAIIGLYVGVGVLSLCRWLIKYALE